MSINLEDISVTGTPSVDNTRYYVKLRVPTTSSLKGVIFTIEANQFENLPDCQLPVGFPSRELNFDNMCFVHKYHDEEVIDVAEKINNEKR